MASALRNITRSGSPVRRVLIWSLLVFIVFSCLAILLTYPLVSNLSHDYFNPTTPHDGVGTIALYWYKDYARQHGLSVPLKLEGKEQTLTFRWDGRPVAENGKVVGLTGNIQVYLFLTRPQFNQTGL